MACADRTPLRPDADGPATVFLPAADALHLTRAAEAGLREVHGSDRHLVAAAPHCGLRAVTL